MVLTKLVEKPAVTKTEEATPSDWSIVKNSLKPPRAPKAQNKDKNNGIEQQGGELSVNHSAVGECQYRECQSVSIPWKLRPLQTSEHWG